MDNLLFKNLGVKDEELGSFVHQIFGDVDARRLSAGVKQTEAESDQGDSSQQTAL